MILLNEISIKNFISYETTRIVLKDKAHYLLDGVSGSGKSSVGESVLWALYGRARSENRNIIRKGATSTTVSVKLTDGQFVFNITRSVSSSGKNTLSVTKSTDGSPFIHIERNGLKDIQDWIENEFLKASYELFTNSIAYPQDNEGSFIKAKATERKNLLLEIVRAGDFDTMYEKARDAFSKEEMTSFKAFTKIEELKKTINDLTPISNKVEEYDKNIKDSTLEIDKFSTEKKLVEDTLRESTLISDKIKEHEKQELRLTSEISSRILEIKKNEDTIKQIESIDIQSARTNFEKARVVSEDILKIELELKHNSDLQSDVNRHLVSKPSLFDYTKDIENINKQLIPLIKESGKCPSGDACPFVIPIKGQITFLSDQIQDKERKMVESKESFNRWNEIYSKLPKPLEDAEYNKLYLKYVEMKSDLKNLSLSSQIINQYELSLKNNEVLKLRNKDLESANERDSLERSMCGVEILKLKERVKNDNFATLSAKFYELTQKVNGATDLRDKYIRYHETSVQARISLKNAQGEVLMLEKDITTYRDNLDALETLKEAFSPRGVKAVVIDYLVPNLEEKINDILSQMSDLRLRLDTQQSKVNEEDGVKEGLFIMVKNPEGVELPISNLSGGETVKVSVAISEALASLMSSVGFRILDEAINSLDSESTQSFVDVLIKLQQKFPQVITISHLPEVKEIFENKIMVSKINGVSKIS